MIDITDCHTLNDIARKIFNKANYTNREKVKQILFKENIDWKKWLEEQKIAKEKFCIVCGKKLEKCQIKFCSHSCSAKYNNAKKSKKNTEFCQECGKVLKNAAKKYCSKKCQKKSVHEQYIKRWKNGEEDGLKGEYGISNHIKRYLMNKYNCKCQKCGWGEVNEFTGKAPLEVHHIDGDYKNNSEENLQLLCPNCHSLTETYKAHNKTGRKERKKYN